MSDTEVRGEVSVLHPTKGDLTLTFDTDDHDEVEKTKKDVADLMRIGYVLLVPHGKGWRRVEKFDPKKGTYKLQRTGNQPAVEVAAKTTKATAIMPSSGG